MSGSDPKVSFTSSLAPLMDQFVREKRAVGYRYEAGAAVLMHLDRFLADHAPQGDTLSRSITRDWLAKRPHESPATQQRRYSLAHQFALFLCRHDRPAYVPDASLAAKGRSGFTPYIFTHEQVRRLLQEADRPAPTALSPLRHLVMPELFRLLYGCGFRVGEVLTLRVGDVDTHRGVLTVRDGKFGKDRLVPPAPSLVKRLRSYEAAIRPLVGRRHADAFYFPSRRGGPWQQSSVYSFFRQMLHRCGIRHGGRGKGPRIHDLRHTFAVHAMLRWYREGADLDTRPERFEQPLFQNRRGDRLSRWGVRYILDKHVEAVRSAHPGFSQKVTPHTLRHTKGMHLLQSGVLARSHPGLPRPRARRDHPDIRPRESRDEAQGP